jgi:hypothetical protein
MEVDMKGSKRTSATLVAALILGATFVPVAIAQTAPPPPPPAIPPPPLAAAITEPGRGAEIGAAFLNVVHVPGKALMCGAGTVASAVLMLATFGSAYGPAAGIFNEGCGGRWLLTPYDVAAVRPPEDR